MGERIAMGFHATVDFELEWDLETLIALVSDYGIRDCELDPGVRPDSERNMLILLLAHMKEGSGAEFTPDANALCLQFAGHFKYRQTLGGTATRAAMAIGRLGYASELSICSFNRWIKEGLPENVHYFSNVGEGSGEVEPHIVFTYPADARIRTPEIDFVTPRENRVMFSNDVASKAMTVSQEFFPRLRDARVFLMGCFNEVLEFDVLRQRMEDVRRLLAQRREDMLLLFEDGCYIQKEFRTYVHRELMKNRLFLVSMNEDELQEYVGKKFDILNAGMVLEAMEVCREEIGVPFLVVHTSKWATALGDGAGRLREGLHMGICLSATHFCCGSEFGKEDFAHVSSLVSDRQGETFCEEIKALAGTRICALPTKDLRKVMKPTVVGLGDCFAGGLALGLAKVTKNN